MIKYYFKILFPIGQTKLALFVPSLTIEISQMQRKFPRSYLWFSILRNAILTLIYFYKSFEIENLKFLFWEFVKSLQTFYCFLRYNQPDRNLIHFSVKTISNILCQTILGNEVFNLASPSSNLDSNPQRGRNKWPLRQINKTMPAKVNPIMKWIDSILPFKPVWWDLLLGESMSIGDPTPATRVEVDF